MKRFPHYVQLDACDCGPACLRMISKFYGRQYSLQTLRKRSFITREGVSMLGISEAAESIGFRTIGLRISLKQLYEDMPLPCILHWNHNHFVVLYKIDKRREGYRYHIADPSSQLVTYTDCEMQKLWLTTENRGIEKGIALALEPSPQFYEEKDESVHKDSINLIFFAKYLLPYRKEFILLILGMLVGTLLQLVFPLLTQSLVDVGINDGNLSFITIILIAQLIMSVSQMSVDFIRSWILLQINTRINISLISDFLIKLMKLPMRFFDSKMIGDIMQRIGDHGRIESFITGSSISMLFSFINFFIFGAILAYYNLLIFGIFLIGNLFYILWIIVFLKYRRELDVKRFAQASSEQSSLIQLVTGMQEIKLNNCERQKRWQWERIQAKLFRINIKGLALGQIQYLGSVLFNQITNIIISFIASKSVVEGQMTLGMMMSLAYITGQLNGPVSAFIEFARQLQDAKISLERLNEIHGHQDEEQQIESKISVLPEHRDIKIKHLSFSYDGADRDYILNNICLTIPTNKVTAIVGPSGSGKTTLLKLILGFYEPNQGEICIGETPIRLINPQLLRAKSGAVLQDGFIFSDTIANNIAVNTDNVDIGRLKHAVMVANIREFIDSLPLGYNTKIGMEGNGISQGQRQRLLIARAVYKNPEFLFFDEATNALDAHNENKIMRHLYELYKGKTVVIVAHRLSTVKNADKIIVLDKGQVVEEGTHSTLIENKGLYYHLVKNQLELGI